MGRWQREALTEGLSALAGSDDSLGNVLRRVQNIHSRNTNDLDSLFAQPPVTTLVTHRIVTHIVRKTVDFDTDPGLGTIKIENICAQRMLAAELDAIGLPAKQFPEQHFGQRHFGTQLACSCKVSRKFLARQIPLRQPCRLPPPHLHFVKIGRIYFAFLGTAFLAAGFFFAGAFLRPLPVEGPFAAFSSISTTACSAVNVSGSVPRGRVALVVPSVT